MDRNNGAPKTTCPIGTLADIVGTENEKGGPFKVRFECSDLSMNPMGPSKIYLSFLVPSKHNNERRYGGPYTTQEEGIIKAMDSGDNKFFMKVVSIRKDQLILQYLGYDLIRICPK